MEFQSPEDNAWYDVILLWDNEMLTVKYVNFPEDFNEIYDVGKFKTLEELEDFKQRFRQSSVQLQDHDCKKVVLGKTFCASYNFENGDVKFFDALVAEVLNKKHKFKQGGGEECLCTYVVRWQNGPLEGERTFARIANFCLTPPSNQVDPSLASFLKLARERIEKGSLGGKDAGHEEPITSDFVSNSVMNLELFFMKLRRQRKNRCAYRTIEGALHSRCKKI
ncbi:hypothetical protein P3X46_012374 [Hevea brasiliensis]|uniref:SAWADEE domain-containing protein n=1 Tax=Hevea brasiliensis TaxID=3981 RepID=A0ABQ9MA03_HEVBR|nr:uncharacterized protein LOC110672698 [Hevea brasiliensis]KAJ9177124.1 hypothetical protein P3X46_012374 [Hevea brasiliensis]